MKDLGIKIPVMGGDALVGKEFLTSGVADGVMYVTGAVGNPDSFQAKVKALSGSTTAINIITPLGYDALHILAKVMNENGTSAKDIIAGLKSLNYTTGVSFPVISYDQNGDLKQATYDVSVVKGSTPQIVTQ
jgi:ABC-type branched-subunit amino acid transport system substrate-binding protein